MPARPQNPAERERRQSYARSRAKLFTEILKTGGYAAFGTGAFEPVIKHVPLGGSNLLLGGLGVALLSLALYIAPRGDDHDWA